MDNNMNIIIVDDFETMRTKRNMGVEKKIYMR